MKSQGFPVETCPIPGLAPDAVTKASERFEELVSEMNDVVAEWSARKRNYEFDLAAAHRTQAEARVAGKKAPAHTPADVDANLARLSGERDALMAAVDAAGDALAEQVEAHRAAWQADAEVVEAEATERLRVALDEVRQACKALEESRVAIPWLESFDLGRVLGGERHHLGGSGMNYRNALAALGELVTGPQPKHIGWRVDEDGNSAPIYERKDRLGRSFTSVR